MAGGMPLGSVIVDVTSHLPTISCVCRHPRVRKCEVEPSPGHFSITSHVSVILVTRFCGDFHFQWDELLKA